MYIVTISRKNVNFDDDRIVVETIIEPLLKSILGYDDYTIKGFKHWLFYSPIAINLTMEQLRLVIQPFWDYDISIMGSEIDDLSGKHIRLIYSKEIGIISQPPQDHYYDEPVIRPDQRIDPWNPPNIEGCIHPNQMRQMGINPNSTPTITCPYCKSTNTKKISGLSKAGNIALWGIFALGKASKQWHCNNCKSDF